MSGRDSVARAQSLSPQAGHGDLFSALVAANQALDALAATLELHAEEPWQVEAHGVACAAWRVTEDALGRPKVDE